MYEIYQMKKGPAKPRRAGSTSKTTNIELSPQKETSTKTTSMEQATSSIMEQASANSPTETTASVQTEQASASIQVEQDPAILQAEEERLRIQAEEERIRLQEEKDWAEMEIAISIWPPEMRDYIRKNALKAYGKEPWRDDLPGVVKLKRLLRENPRLNLVNCVDLGNLFTIGQRYVEFRPIVRMIFRMKIALPLLSKIWQWDVIDTIAGIEKILNQLVPFKEQPYDPVEVNAMFAKMGRHLDRLCGILQMTQNMTLTWMNVYAWDVVNPAQRRDLVLREDCQIADENFLRTVGHPQTYLATRLDVRYLEGVMRDHPEFTQAIQTVFNVYRVMRYLSYKSQVKLYEVMLKIEKTIRDLVSSKKYRSIVAFERYVTYLQGRLKESFTSLLDCLHKEIDPPRQSADTFCERCQEVVSFIKNVNVKPQQKTRKVPTNPHSNLKGVVAYANVGISQERVKNLESLIHHLAAKKGYFRHVFLYKNRIDWSQVAQQYIDYRSKAKEGLVKLKTLKGNFLQRIAEVEDVMVDGRDFCDRVRNFNFTGNEILSDSIALGGELELLSSEAEDYLTGLNRLLGHFLFDFSRCLNVNQDIRKSRFSFLTKDQWKAFDFPY